MVAHYYLGVLLADKKTKIRKAILLTEDQWRAVTRATADLPVHGAGQATISTVIGNLIDEHLVGEPVNA